VFVAVEAGDHTPQWLERFAVTVSAMPEVMEIYRHGRRRGLPAARRGARHGPFDAFYKRLIAAAPLKNVTSRFAMERIKATTALPPHPSAFRTDGSGVSEPPAAVVRSAHSRDGLAPFGMAFVLAAGSTSAS